MGESFKNDDSSKDGFPRETAKYVCYTEYIWYYAALLRACKEYGGRDLQHISTEIVFFFKCYVSQTVSY